VDGGLLGVLVGVGATAVLASVGWAIRRHLDRLQATITGLTSKMELAQKTIENKDETIAVLRQQVSEYKIIGQIQDRFFGSLPPRDSSGDR